MIIYAILILFLIILFAFVKNRKSCIIIAFATMAIISSLRSYSVGVDTLQYEHIFIVVGGSNDSIFDYRVEFGFALLCKFLSFISKSPQILIITTSIFINFSFAKFVYNHSNDYKTSIFLYLFLNIFFMSMNIMRQVLAISILLFGYSHYKNNNFKKFLPYILLAMCFHKVAILMVIPFLMNIIAKNKILYLTSIIMTVLVFINIDFVFNLMSKIFGYNEYLGTSFFEGNKFGSVFNFAVYLLLLLFSYKGCKKEGKIFQQTYILIIILLFYSCRIILIERLYQLFIPFLIVMIPNGISNLKYNINKKQFVYFVAIVYFVIICFLRPEWYGVEYSFFWTKNIREVLSI